MLATALLVFREVLEAALIVTIVLAATRELAARKRYIAFGILLGVCAAVLVAVFAGRLAELAGGVGQELFNASVLLAAAAMIGWHVVWMARHGRVLATQIRALGAQLSAGERSLTALTVLVALAVAREGSEVVLFLYGMSAGGIAGSALLGGSFAGLCAGVACGGVLYFGLLQIPMGQFFRVTNGLLMLLAAGLAAQAARFLVQADLLPALGNRLWDTSWLLSEQSLAGQVLHVLVGYTARPSGMQVLFYVSTVIIFIVGARLCRPLAQRAESPA